ncbi:MAG: hydroxymethylbilane synthase [Dehalococcoidia bacterium]
MTPLRIGTRGSRLALIQVEQVVARLRSRDASIEIEVVEIATRGDRDQVTPLASGSGAGWFTSVLQEAVAAGEVDAAIHSYKDLPTRRPEGLVIAAVPLREDARDALISRTGVTLKQLPAGAVVGTGSPRRAEQVREMRPDVEVRSIRGNVDTRIRKVDEGDYDAAVLALAGLRRLGAERRANEIFGIWAMVPAPAQGALAVECRADDERARRLFGAIHDPTIGQAVSAERAFLAALEAGCSFPAGAYAEHFGSTIKLHGMVAPGRRVVRAKTTGPVEAAAGLGRALAAELLGKA